VGSSNAGPGRLAGLAVRNGLLRGLVLLILVTGGAILVATLLSAGQTARELSDALIRATSDRVEVELDRLFAPVRSGLRIAQGWGRRGALPLDDPEALGALLMPFLADNPLISSIMLADARGAEYMLRRSGADAPARWSVRVLPPVAAAPARLLELAGDGAVISEEQRVVTYDPRERPWFRGAQEAVGGIYWTEPYPFLSARAPGLTAAAAWEAAGGTLHVVGMDVLLSDLSAFTSSLPVGPGGRVLVLDDRGRTLGLPRDRRFETAEGTAAALLEPVDALEIPAVASAFETWLRDESEPGAPLAIESGDETWWAGFRPYALSEDRLLWIGVVLPEAELLRGVVARRDRILAFTGAGLVVAVVLAFALDRLVRWRVESALRGARRMGQYTLEHEIGRGGMGTVYRARHALLRRPTAVKVLEPEKDEEAVARFEREVQLTAELTHPNTIVVYDYGRTPEGHFYYAMESLSGLTLLTLVEHFGTVPPDRAIAILTQICGSLAEAHSRGLVHRDVKPQNVMLCERGGRHDVVKVLDFGLVKDLGGRESLELTKVTAIPGSPLFISPEAVRGADRVEPRSDLYSLGAVGYFLLTGRPVFDGANAWIVCLSHLRKKPEAPSARLGRVLPADLERVILECLAKDPEARPPSAEALAERLAACVDAGRWSEARARAWWRDHMAELADLLADPEDSPDGRDLEIDLRERGPGDGGR
jgi:serine/threonine protein kinase